MILPPAAFQRLQALCHGAILVALRASAADVAPLVVLAAQEVELSAVQEEESPQQAVPPAEPLVVVLLVMPVLRPLVLPQQRR